MTDHRELLDRAIDQAGGVIAGISPDQAALPTPCTAWDVRTLVGHVVDDLGQFTRAAQGGRPAFAKSPPTVDGDWAAAFRAGAPGLMDAWRQAGDLSATVTMPIGDRPLEFVVDQQIAEFAVHAWDLATATGQPVTFDPEIAETALAWSRTTLKPEFRGPDRPFGAEVPIAADAPVYDRLAAFFGRDPR
jgi:uncharacterized protein (TIGR03086 family)